MLRNAVSLFQRLKLLRRIHLCQNLYPNTISTNILHAGNDTPHLHCHGPLFRIWRRCVLHIYIHLYTSRCVLGRFEEIRGKVYQRERVRSPIPTPRSHQLNPASRARYAHGTLNMVTDLLIAALPVRVIWRLQLVRRQKIALVAILTLGWVYVYIVLLSTMPFAHVAQRLHHLDSPTDFPSRPRPQRTRRHVLRCAPNLLGSYRNESGDRVCLRSSSETSCSQVHSSLWISAKRVLR
jgi:hypothetical protein